MNNLTFTLLLDVPLVCMTLTAFIWHFNWWAIHGDVDSTIDLASRLSVARWRVVFLLVGILLLCWLLNIAVWAIFVVLFGIGVAIVFIAGLGMEAGGGGFVLLAVAFLIREWCFGFPQLILLPETHDSSVARPTVAHPAADTNSLVGKSGVAVSPLRPTGEAEIEGVVYTVASADGRMLDRGTLVTDTLFRNGRPCVAPVSETSDAGNQCPGSGKTKP
ncbi:MAG: hypothetical protein R3C05_02015 [Pirellulaceae bacterium]